MKHYYYYQNKERFGPLTLDQLMDSNIEKNTMAWHEGLEDWVEAKEIPEVNKMFEKIPPPIPELIGEYSNNKVFRNANFLENEETLEQYSILSFNWFLKAITQDYATFKGRARRREFWSFQFYNSIFLILASLLFVVGVESNEEFLSTITSIIFFIYLLYILIPSLSLQVRRLHDIGNSGWLLLISLIPYLGGLILFIMNCIDSSKGRNLYGPNPKGIDNYY